MIELPGSLRDLVLERVDEALEVSGASKASAWTDCVLSGLEALAEEMEEDIGENLVSKLEESGELEQSLSKELTESYKSLSDPSGDELIRVLERACEVAWINEDGDDEIAKGFMESDGYQDEEF
jgi:hypothetical protein